MSSNSPGRYLFCGRRSRDDRDGILIFFVLWSVLREILCSVMEIFFTQRIRIISSCLYNIFHTSYMQLFIYIGLGPALFTQYCIKIKRVWSRPTMIPARVCIFDVFYEKWHLRKRRRAFYRTHSSDCNAKPKRLCAIMYTTS